MRKLVIGVSPELAATPEVQALSPRTCDVRVVEELATYDIVLSDRAWYMPLTHIRYLEVALKTIRKLVRNQAKETKWR